MCCLVVKSSCQENNRKLCSLFFFSSGAEGTGENDTVQSSLPRDEAIIQVNSENQDVEHPAHHDQVELQDQEMMDRDPSTKGEAMRKGENR